MNKKNVEKSDFVKKPYRLHPDIDRGIELARIEESVKTGHTNYENDFVNDLLERAIDFFYPNVTIK